MSYEIHIHDVLHINPDFKEIYETIKKKYPGLNNFGVINEFNLNTYEYLPLEDGLIDLIDDDDPTILDIIEDFSNWVVTNIK